MIDATYSFERAVRTQFEDELSQLKALIDELIDSEDASIEQLCALNSCKRNMSALDDYFALTLKKLIDCKLAS